MYICLNLHLKGYHRSHDMFMYFEKCYWLRIDANILNFTDQLVLRHFKTSIPILNGDYTKQQYQAFFETCVEPLLKIITENLNKVIYHNRDIHNFEIKFNSNALKLMSTRDLIDTCTLLLNTTCIK